MSFFVEKLTPVDLLFLEKSTNGSYSLHFGAVMKLLTLTKVNLTKYKLVIFLQPNVEVSQLLTIYFRRTLSTFNAFPTFWLPEGLGPFFIVFDCLV